MLKQIMLGLFFVFKKMSVLFMAKYIDTHSNILYDTPVR